MAGCRLGQPAMLSTTSSPPPPASLRLATCLLEIAELRRGEAVGPLLLRLALDLVDTAGDVARGALGPNPLRVSARGLRPLRCNSPRYQDPP
jgi:hypothetical protein